MRVVSSAAWEAGANTHTSHAQTDRRTLSKLGEGLRGLYQATVDQPLPEALTQALRQLEREPERAEAGG